MTEGATNSWGAIVRIRQATYALAVATLCTYAATTGGSFATDLASYEVTRNIVERGSMAMSYNVLATEAERGVDGRYYAPVGLGHPLFGVPFYVAGRAVQQVTGVRLGKPESLLKAAVVAGSAVAAALTVVVAFRFAAALSSSPIAAGAMMVALGLSTILWPYSKFGFNAPLAALGVTAGLFGVWSGTRSDNIGRILAGAACLGYAALTRHELFLIGLPVLVWLVLESPSTAKLARRGLAFALPFGAAFCVWIAYNYVRFGHPLDTGLMRDPGIGFDAPLLTGLHGLLLSPGRSLFLFDPVLLASIPALVWLWRRDRNSAFLLGGSALLLLIVIAKMRVWDGGESYGPRYLVPAIPLLAVATTPWLAAGKGRRLVAALAFAGLLVQIPGILVDYSAVQNEYARSRPGYSIQLSRYTCSASPLVLNVRAAAAAVPRNIAYLRGSEVPPTLRAGVSEADRGFSQQFAFSLNFWWLYLFYLGAVPASLSVATGCVLALGGLVGGLLFAHFLRDGGYPGTPGRQ